MATGRPRTTSPGTCELCGQLFSRIITVDGKRRTLYSRRACPACQPFGTRRRTPEQLLAKPSPRAILFTPGTRIGGWTLVREVPRENPRVRQYLCRCGCGTEKVFAAVYLRTGRPSVCEACQGAKVEAAQLAKMTGLKRGDYTVIAYKGKNAWGTRLWLCRCKCGAERVYPTGQILSQGTQRTQCERCYSGEMELSHRVHDYIPERFWKRLLDSARRRGIECTLTQEEAFAQLVAQGRTCALSGRPLYFTTLRTRYHRYTTASLDRIDPNKGYSKENIQWVHKVVNMMKGSLEQSELIEWCSAVTVHRNGLASISSPSNVAPSAEAKS